MSHAFDTRLSRIRFAQVGQTRVKAQKNSPHLRARQNGDPADFLVKNNHADDRDYDINPGETVWAYQNDEMDETDMMHRTSALAGASTFSAFNNFAVRDDDARTEKQKRRQLLSEVEKLVPIGVAITPAEHHTRERTTDDVVDYTVAMHGPTQVPHTGTEVIRVGQRLFFDFDVHNLGKGMDRSRDNDRRLWGIEPSKMLPLLRGYDASVHRLNTNNACKSLSALRAGDPLLPEHRVEDDNSSTSCDPIDDGATGLLAAFTSAGLLFLRMMLSDVGEQFIELRGGGVFTDADQLIAYLAQQLGLGPMALRDEDVRQSVMRLPGDPTSPVRAPLLHHWREFLTGKDPRYLLTRRTPEEARGDPLVQLASKQRNGRVLELALGSVEHANASVLNKSIGFALADAYPNTDVQTFLQK